MAPSTVSRAFTRPGRVNAATRDHVLAVAERLGYAPNPAAQALESGRSNTVALVVPDITNPYFAGVIKGAERAAAAGRADPGARRHPGEPGPRGAARPAPRPGRRRVRADGLPDARPRAAADRGAQPGRAGQPGLHRPGQRGRRLRRGHPADRGPPRLARAPVVRVPGRAGRVLVGRAPLGGAAARPPAEHGLEATRVRALPPDPRLGTRRPPTPCSRTGPRRSWRTTTCWPSACSRGWPQRGVAVPEQVSVVGFDNVFGSDFCHPPLTTLAERTEEAGARAIAALGAAGRTAAPRTRPRGCCPPSSWCAPPAAGPVPAG